MSELGARRPGSILNPPKVAEKVHDVNGRWYGRPLRCCN